MACYYLTKVRYGRLGTPLIKNQHQIGAEKLLRIKVLMAVTMKTTLFWDVTLCSLPYRFLQNVCTSLPNYMASWHHIPGTVIFMLSEDYI
jgi:hypothetical protein